YSFQLPFPHPSLHSFPTRRSSDLLLRQPSPIAVQYIAVVVVLGQRVARPLPRELGELWPLRYRRDLHAVIIAKRADLSHNRTARDRKSTRLNSSHVAIPYAVFRLT